MRYPRSIARIAGLVSGDGRFGIALLRQAAERDEATTRCVQGWSKTSRATPSPLGRNDIDWTDAAGNVTNKALLGAALGDLDKTLNVTERKSLEYFGGWFVASVALYIDVAADTRDYLVVDKDATSNVLDCGGALISFAGSVAGILTAPTGLGAALAGGSLAVDSAEDTTDAVSITVTFLK